MSIVECTGSKSPLLELISECLDEKQWEEYLKAFYILYGVEENPNEENA